MCKNKQEFNLLVEKYRELTAMKKAAEEGLKKVKPDMEEYIRAKGKPSGKDGKSLVILGDDYKATLNESERMVFDGDKLADLLGPDLAQYQKSSLSTRIDVR